MALAAYAASAAATLAQVVSVPRTVVVERPAPDVRIPTVLMDSPNMALRIPTVLFRCDGDLNADNDTDFSDLNLLLGNWGCIAPPGVPPASCFADINFDGRTDFTDLNLLLGAFGTSCP